MYSLKMSKEEFKRIKNDKLLHVVLSFARSINALHFTMFTCADFNGDTIPDMKYRTNSFLYTLAVLYEGFNIVDRNYLILKDIDSFKNGFAILMLSKEIRRFRNDILSRNRNHYCFHFLEDKTIEILNYLDFDEYEFALADGMKANNFYYGLSDLVAINSITKNKKVDTLTDDEYFVKVINDTVSIANEYIRCAEMIINEYIDKTNWSLEEK